jgi:hypothetical protein
VFNRPLPNMAVHLVAVGGSADAVPVATSTTNGSYEFDAVPPGGYQVEFVDPNHAYKTQWYNGTAAGAADQSGASTVTLSAAKATTGVDASLVAGS